MDRAAAGEVDGETAAVDGQADAERSAVVHGAGGMPFPAVWKRGETTGHGAGGGGGDVVETSGGGGQAVVRTEIEECIGSVACGGDLGAEIGEIVRDGARRPRVVAEQVGDDGFG